jgi:hypothetical protein
VNEHLAACLRAELTPFVLILDQDFASFEPGSHGWAIAWLLSPPDTPKVRQGLARLVAEPLSEVDLFKRLKAIAERRRERSSSVRRFKFSSQARAAVDLEDIATPP